jgi:hypothetical protein
MPFRHQPVNTGPSRLMAASLHFFRREGLTVGKESDNLRASKKRHSISTSSPQLTQFSQKQNR